ncbi:MAG: hypothetical protein LBV08_10050 [Clostridiales bacterium]|jgi:hypothetical protein|nr:hypothetical protein [Clostridiales bacterium]
MKRWELNHLGNTIVVENSALSERLYVNGELQDEQVGLGMRSRLWGKLPAGEEIKVSVGGSTWNIQCRIFIDNKLVLPE